MSALSTYQSNPWPEPIGRTKSRVSAWFHGRSVVGKEKSQPLQRATKSWRSTGLYVSPEMGTNLPTASGLRSPSSTRSIIDPSSSPNRGCSPAFRSMRQEQRRLLEATRYDEDEIVALAGDPRTRTRLALSRTRSNPHNNKPSRGCLPRVKNHKVRSKAVGCLTSGGLLVSTLTTCKSGLSGGEIFRKLINFRPRTYNI